MNGQSRKIGVVLYFFLFTDYSSSRLILLIFTIFTNIVLIFLQFALMVSENISLFVACSVVIIAICDFIIKDIRK